MKELLDFRGWVLGLLATAGFFFLVCMCGKPDPEMSQTQYWETLATFGVLAASCFAGFYGCMRLWDNDIKE